MPLTDEDALRAYDVAEDMSKMSRLRGHVEWAAAHGCLQQVHEFMRSLPEDEWHHIGE